MKELIQNHRPISFLSIIGKGMESCVFKYLYNYLVENKLITSFQSGFRSGDSTTDQLLLLANIFGKAIDDGKEIRVMFFDISKAFDIVWHAGLIHKLQNIGSRDPLLKWFNSYLSDRKQRVIIVECPSRLFNIRTGVPRIFILGPLLFLIFINDTVDEIQCNIRLFVDDTSLHLVVEDEYEAAIKLNTHTEKYMNGQLCGWLILTRQSLRPCQYLKRLINHIIRLHI